jgi:hypothetical protein
VTALAGVLSAWLVLTVCSSALLALLVGLQAARRRLSRRLARRRSSRRHPLRGGHPLAG